MLGNYVADSAFIVARDVSKFWPSNPRAREDCVSDIAVFNVTDTSLDYTPAFESKLVLQLASASQRLRESALAYHHWAWQDGSRRLACNYLLAHAQEADRMSSYVVVDAHAVWRFLPAREAAQRT